MRKAFTLIELLVVMAIIAVLVMILVPVVMTALGKSEVTICQNNLGVIGRKYNDYANDSEYADTPFPRHTLVEATGGNILDNPNTVTPGGAATDGLRTNGGSTLDIAATGIGTCGMQTVWVLIAEGLIPDSAFKCPGDEGYVARSGPLLLKYGWTNLQQFSYGIAFPYNGVSAADQNKADPMAKDGKGRLLYRENMPLFADRNPNGAVGSGAPAIEHSNHPGNDGGMIVVSRIGNTTFHKPVETAGPTFTPDSVLGGDNIYTETAVGEGVPVPTAFPLTSDDTIITPVDSKGDRD